MNLFTTFWVQLRDFFDMGGSVLWAILFATILMWTLIIERFWFFKSDMPKLMNAALREWEQREEVYSWHAHRIRDAMISELRVRARLNLGIIRAIMAALPLLGLLGTVTGMIQVFDVMAITGTGNARAMAGGVSAATIPTMCGLVAALSGLYFVTHLERNVAFLVEQFEDKCVVHHAP